MCLAIALPISELPEELVRMHQRRVVAREPAGTREVRFLFRDPQPVLPVWVDCRLLVVPWGNRAKTSRLPRTGWCRLEDLEAGLWRHLQPESAGRVPGCHRSTVIRGSISMARLAREPGWR